MREWNGNWSLPDQPSDEPEEWTDEDQDALDDYNQMKEDEAMDERG